MTTSKVKYNLLLDFLFQSAYFLHRCLEINAELEVVTHIWASVEIADGFHRQNRIWVVHFLIVSLQKHSRKDIHLFHNHLQFFPRKNKKRKKQSQRKEL